MSNFKQPNEPDFPVAHYRDPSYVRRMERASEQFLAALKREHPEIIHHLTRVKKRGADQ